jgi:flagellar L-ring protein FlgH
MERKRCGKISFVSATCLVGTLALGQTAPTAADGRAETMPERTSPRPANNNNAAQAGAIMQRTGASLLKAQLSAQPDPAQAKLPQVSFLAVPEQQPKKLKKHDLVTIVIREESDIQSKGETDLKKDAALQAEVNQFIKLKLGKGSIYGLPTPATTPGIDLTGHRQFNGTGEVDRTDTFTARITAEVLDVKPNGTLVLQARKHIKTDDEEQMMVLTGTCRVEDVTADNSVLSTQLHDLDLQKNHKGDVRSATQRGVLPKLLDFINPF